MKKRLQRGVIIKTLQEHFEKGVYWYFVKKNKNDDRMFVKQIVNGLLKDNIITATNMQDNIDTKNILYPISINTSLFGALKRISNIPEKVNIVCDLSINHIYNILQQNDEIETIVKFINLKYNKSIYCTCGNILIGDNYFSIDLIPLNSNCIITLTNKTEQRIYKNPKSKVKKRSCFGYTRV